MFGDIPIPESCLFRAFYGEHVNPSGSGQASTKAFTIPNGASMMYAVLIGAGGAGGNGFTGATSTNRFGGGGGGSGAITRILIPTKVLPQCIYVRPGMGGVQGVQPIGQDSALMLFPNLSLASDLNGRIATAAGGGAGATGTGTAGGTAGAAGTAASNTGAVAGSLGLWSSSAGQAGAAGGASVTWGNTGIVVSGGAGGGGASNTNTNQAGGTVTGQLAATTYPVMPTISGGTAPAGRGVNGANFNYSGGMFRSSGGGGGASDAAGTGGTGGNGGWGSGGGGGGGGITGGTGGNGGPGVVLIWVW